MYLILSKLVLNLDNMMILTLFSQDYEADKEQLK